MFIHIYSISINPSIYPRFMMQYSIEVLTAGVLLAKVYKSLRLLLTSLLMVFSWELRFWLAAYAHRTPALGLEKRENPPKIIPTYAAIQIIHEDTDNKASGKNQPVDGSTYTKKTKFYLFPTCITSFTLKPQIITIILTNHIFTCR